MANLEKVALLKGLKTERRSMEYTWRDAALYALAVGAKDDETFYTYEKGMKALPTFGVTPYWGTVNVTPRIPRPASCPVLADEWIASETSFVNLEYELVMHRPIDPIKGTFLYRDVVTDVYDRGTGKGAALKTCTDVYDESGVLLCSNHCTTLFLDAGGFGGAPMPPNPVTIPDRDPDLTVDDHLGPMQHMLYRLTGDTNLVHCDAEVAESKGLKGPFVQDLCNFGFACRMAIRALFPGQPERVRRIAAQIRTILYPDTPVQLQLWNMGEGRAYFRFVNRQTGKANLDRGVLEWV